MITYDNGFSLLEGAAMMGKDLDYIIQETINGMKVVASKIGLAG